MKKTKNVIRLLSCGMMALGMLSNTFGMSMGRPIMRYSQVARLLPYYYPLYTVNNPMEIGFTLTCHYRPIYPVSNPVRIGFTPEIGKKRNSKRKTSRVTYKNPDVSSVEGAPTELPIIAGGEAQGAEKHQVIHDKEDGNKNIQDEQNNTHGDVPENSPSKEDFEFPEEFWEMKEIPEYFASFEEQDVFGMGAEDFNVDDFLL